MPFQGISGASFGISAGRNISNNLFRDVGKQIAEEEGSETNIFFDALELLGRPANAVAGFATGIASGDIGTAFENLSKGVTGQDHFNFSGVLKKLGVGKGGSIDVPLLGEITGRGVFGFGLDILTDPLTYVGLSSFTTASRKGLRTALSQNEKKSVGKILNFYDENIGRKGEVLIKKREREVREAFENEFLEVESRYRKTAPNDLANFQTGTDAAIFVDGKLTRNTPLLEERVGQALTQAERDFSAPTTRFAHEQAAFRQRAKVVLKEDFDNIEDVVSANDMLDLALQSNRRLDVFRAIEDSSPIMRGATRAAQAEKGNRSILTFMGKGTPEIARALGLPEVAADKLRALDIMVHKQLDVTLAKVADWPVFRDIRNKLSNHTGIKALDEFIQYYKDRGLVLQREALANGVKAVEKQLSVTAGMNPKQTQESLERIIDSLEWDNPNNILGEAFAPGNALTPLEKDLALQLRETLDDSFRMQNEAGKELGLATNYLRGYFPRKLTPEVKEILDDAIVDTEVRQKIFLTSSLSREGKFAKLTTNQINELFRNQSLGIRHLEEVINRDPKILKRLQKADKEFADLFLTNPADAVGIQLAASATATTNREFITAALQTFGRRVSSKAARRRPGEVILVPTAFFQELAPNQLTDAQVIKKLRDIFKLPDADITEIKRAYDKIRTDDMLRPGERVLDRHTGNALKLFTEVDIENPNLLAAMSDLDVPFYIMDRQVANHLNTAYFTRKAGEKIGAVGKLYDGITTIWKRLTLTPFAEFHSRNLISDIGYMGYMSGALNAREVFSKDGAYLLAARMIRDTGAFKGLKGVRPISELGAGVGLQTKAYDGTLLKGDQLFREFYEHGLMSGTIRDIEQASNVKSLNQTVQQQLEKVSFKEGAKRRLDIRKPSFFILPEATKIGDGLQIYSRLAHYISKRKAGLSPDEAAMNVKKFLFDYGDLTNFERNSMRRVFPFYTWLRKNIPLQLELMVKQPGHFANVQKMIRALEDPEVRKNIPPGGVPGFVKREYGIAARQNEGITEFLMLGQFLPMTDLVRIGSVKDATLTGLKSLNPIPQVFAESALGKNFFRNLDISQYPGEKGKFLGFAMDKHSINAANKIRALSWMDRMVFSEKGKDPYRRKQFTISERLLQVGTGLRPLQIEPEKIAKAKAFRSGIIAGKLQKAMDRAQKTGDKAMIEWLNDAISEAKLDR